MLFGEDQTEQAVTYRFTATNPGEEPLNRPGAEGGGPGTKDPGWVEDIAPDVPGAGRCDSPPTYDGGDANDNDLLDPGEEWEFSCPGTVTGPTVNIARLVGQPSNDGRQPHYRRRPGRGPGGRRRPHGPSGDHHHQDRAA